MWKDGVIYTTPDTLKWSLKKIDETYKTFSEGIADRFPGYELDEKKLVKNVSDETIDLEELKAFLLSKNPEEYD
jgi:hypothetical protein